MTTFNVHLRAYPIMATRKNLLISNPDLWSCINCADTNAQELSYSKIDFNKNKIMEYQEKASLGVSLENSSTGSIVVRIGSSISLEFNATDDITDNDNSSEITYFPVSKLSHDSLRESAMTNISDYVEPRLFDIVELSNIAESFDANDVRMSARHESVSSLGIILMVLSLLSFGCTLLYSVKKLSRWLKVFLDSRFSLYLDRLEVSTRNRITKKEFKSVISQLLENIPIIRNKMGAAHSDTVAFQHFLAKAYMGNLEYISAETVLREVIASYEPFGEDAYVALAFEDLAVCLHAQGPHRTEEALTAALTSLRMFTEEALYNFANAAHRPSNADDSVPVFASRFEPAITSRASSEVTDAVLSASAQSPTSPTMKNGRTIRHNPPDAAGVFVRRKLGYQMTSQNVAGTPTNKDGHGSIPAAADGSLNDFFWSPACKASAKEAASVLLNSTKKNNHNKQGIVEQHQLSLDESIFKENSDEISSVRIDLQQQSQQLDISSATQSLSRHFDNLADIDMQLKDMEALLTVASDDQLDFEKSSVDHENVVINSNVARLKKRIGIIVFNLCNLEEAQKYFELSLQIYMVLREAQEGDVVTVENEISEIQEYLAKLAACLGDDDDDGCAGDLVALPGHRTVSSNHAAATCTLSGAATAAACGSGETGSVSPSPSTVMFSGSARPSPNMPTC